MCTFDPQSVKVSSPHTSTKSSEDEEMEVEEMKAEEQEIYNSRLNQMPKDHRTMLFDRYDDWLKNKSFRL